MEIETVITIAVRAALTLAAFTFVACVIGLAAFVVWCIVDAWRVSHHLIDENDDGRKEERDGRQP